MRKMYVGLVTLLMVLLCVTGALAAHSDHTVCGVFITSGDCNGTTHEAGNEHGTVTGWKALPAAGATITANTRYYLEGDTTLTGPIVVNGSYSLNLCLNGYTLTMGVDGDVIQAGAGSTVTICDCSSAKTGKLVHASYKTGRAVYMKGSDSTYATLYVYGGTFSKHSVGDGEYGAAFYLENTFARMFDCEISGNSSGDEDAGTVYVTGYNSWSDLYLYKDAKICNNTSGLVGGVLVHGTRVSGLDDADKIPRLYMMGGEISGNRGRKGGGVKVSGYAQLWLSTGSINNNSAASYGGGVFVDNLITGTKYPYLYMCGSGSITNNTAPGGGGVFNRGYFLANSTGSIFGNSATLNGTGGGLHTAYGDTMIWQLTITGNTAERAAGGVYIGNGYNGGSLTFAVEKSDPSARYIRRNYVGGVENNVYLEDDSRIWVETASLEGGADIGVTVEMLEGSNTYRFLAANWDRSSAKLVDYLDYFVSDQGYTIAMDSYDYGIMTRALYTVDVTGGTGSGSYAPGDKVTVTATPAEGQTFVGWIAKGVTLTDPTAATVTFTMPDQNVTLKAGYATPHHHHQCGADDCDDGTHAADIEVDYQGWNGTTDIEVPRGGIAYYYLVDDVETTKTINIGMAGKLYLCLNGKTLSKNTAIVAEGRLYLCDCAGGGVITSPANAYNRGVEISPSGFMYMYGGEISGHSVTAKHGAGIYNQGVLYIYGGKITGNAATRNTTLEQGGYGGGVYSDDELIIYGGEISGNKANTAGGVYVYGDDASDLFQMTGGEISGNTATSSNGGMWINGQAAMTATLTGGTIRNNLAGVSGGGVGVSGQAKLHMSGMTFSGNKNTGSGGGGGLYLSGMTTNKALVQKCSFSGNDTSMYGGAISVSGCKVDLKDLIITGNYADNGGGGVSVIGSNNEVLIHNCTIIGNENEQIYGGGLYVGASGVTLSGDTTITGNTAAGKTVNMQLSSGVTTGGSVPKVTADFSGNVGVRTFYEPTATSGRPFIANAAGGAVTAAQMARFSSDEGYAKRINADGYGELYVSISLTVVNGFGSGDYAQNEAVTIIANEAPAGQTFDKWVITAGTATIASPTSANTTLTMGAADVTVEATYKTRNYSVLLSASPIAGGQVTGGGEYPAGSTVTLTATPNAGWQFDGWFEDDGIAGVSPDASYSFVITGDTELTARFTQDVYTLTLTASTAEGGTVTGGGQYTHGASVTVTATPAAGYAFTNWTDASGTIVSTQPEYTFTITGPTQLMANFYRQTKAITLIADPAEGGTVTGGGDYPVGSTAVVTATPNEGWQFDGWFEDDGIAGLSPDATYSFAVTDDMELTARFSKILCNVTATVVPAEAGTVTGAGTYEYGDTVTLKATPGDHSTFIAWVDADGNEVSVDTTYTFTATGDVNLTASFTRSKYNLSLAASPAEGGTVEGGGVYDYGTSVTVTTTPAGGYTFTNWTDASGAVASTEAEYTFTLTGTTYLTANFVREAKTITLNVNPAEGGTVTGAGTYAYGAQATVTAVPNEGYAFTGWTDLTGVTVSTNASYTLTMTANVALTANFAQQTRDVVLSANPLRGGTVSGAGTYAYGAQATITATPNEGYEFTGWMNTKGTVVSTDTSYTLTMDSHVYLVAQFVRKTYSITATASPVEGGTVTGAGTYKHGDAVTLTAVPNAGWNFLGWRAVGTRGDYLSTDAAYTFTATEALDLLACFDKQEPPVIVTHPADQTVTEGDKATFTASARSAKSMTCQWQVDTGDGVWRDIRNANSTTLTLTASMADNGNRYRCVFSNEDGTAVTNPAKLTVTPPVPQTGDGAQPALLAALMLLSLMAAILLRRRAA